MGLIKYSTSHSKEATNTYVCFSGKHCNFETLVSSKALSEVSIDINNIVDEESGDLIRHVTSLCQELLICKSCSTHVQSL